MGRFHPASGFCDKPDIGRQFRGFYRNIPGADAGSLPNHPKFGEDANA
jgi:hypothetical protein